ncbi:MAG: apolipoprotein N-acyltransferase [Verrucomicrobia bacterium]|nr:apolipoprotein N-acyltransferase [Verrucomicrobiota bacterium]
MSRFANIFSGRLPRYAAAVASGALLTAAFAPQNLSLVVWFWILPLLIALWSRSEKQKLESRKQKIKGGFALGYIAGLAFFIPNLAWVRHSSRVLNGAIDDRWMGWPTELMGWSAVLAMCLYMSLYWGAWAAFAATIGKPQIGSVEFDPKSKIQNPKFFGSSIESLRSAFLNAALWTGLEWARGIVLTGFNWNGLGVPLASELSLVQAADIVGVAGLSFMPVFCACIAYNTALRFREEARTARVRPHLDFFCAVALVLADFIYGFRILSAPPAKDTITLRVVLVQQNIPQVVKWSRDHDEAIYQGYGKLTQPFAGSTDLVIWPESALPLPFHHPGHATFLNDVLGLGDFSLLTGVDIIQEGHPSYTGAALMRGSVDRHQLYRKIQLVPFGEFLPLRSVPLIQKLLGGVLPGDFTRGASTEPLILEKPAGVQIIPLICFEDTFGRLARKFARDAPQLLVNCTNDGWFLHSEENEQHLAAARFRCIELRRPMVRAANTGVTCVIGSDGRIRPEDRLTNKRTGSVFTQGALSREILLEKNPPLTFYAQYGDVFSVALLVIASLAMFTSRFKLTRTA